MHNLKTDPEVGPKLYEAILTAPRKGYNEFSIGNHCNGGMVLPSQHADCTQIIAVGGNYIKSLADNNYVNMEDPVEVAKHLAATLGYRLVKRKA
jgi:hypothetical protein